MIYDFVSGIANFFDNIWKWITNIFDFISYVRQLTSDCFNWLNSSGLPVPFISLLLVLLAILLALKLAGR